MTTLHQKIIDLITAPENRAEVGYVQLTMRPDGTWSITIQTKPPAPATIDQWREEETAVDTAVTSRTNRSDD